jgi:protein gp37
MESSMNKTGIEYLTHTWNPVAMRCTKVSAGCLNCWHLRMANRHAANHTIRSEIREARAGGPPSMIEGELDAPLRLRKPAVIGVQFMGDLFHESIHTDWAQLVIAVAAMAPWHRFLLLTKRPGQAAGIFNLEELDIAHSMAMDEYGHHVFDVHARRRDDGRATAWCFEDGLPPNLWLGVSVEDQETADERIPALLELKAAVRFVSYEPAIGPVDFQHWPGPGCDPGFCLTSCGDDAHPVTGHRGIDWVVAGAETGVARRHADPDWFRLARDRCAAERIPFFFKKQTDGRRTIDGVMHEAMP